MRDDDWYKKPLASGAPDLWIVLAIVVLVLVSYLFGW